MPVPTPSGVSVISIGMLKPKREQVVAWRGPMLDRALVQMLADVYWGDLDAAGFAILNAVRAHFPHTTSLLMDTATVTADEMTYDGQDLLAMSDAQRRRALHNLEHRLDGTVLTVSASTQRSQVCNRAEARERMAALLREALVPPPPPRRKTKPTRGSVRRRLEAKKRRSELKSTRRRPRL